MALAIMIYLPVLFEHLRGIRKSDSKHSEEYIRDRVQHIYFEVTHFYNQLGALREDVGGPTEWPDFDHLYCSEAWNKVVDALQHSEALSSATEKQHPESLPTTGSYWLGVPGLGFLYINKVEVIDHTGDQGTVSLVLHNGDAAVPVLLNMVYERDDWFIDNITYYWNVCPSKTGRGSEESNELRPYDWRQEMALIS